MTTFPIGSVTFIGGGISSFVGAARAQDLGYQTTIIAEDIGGNAGSSRTESGMVYQTGSTILALTNPKRIEQLRTWSIPVDQRHEIRPDQFFVETGGGGRGGEWVSVDEAGRRSGNKRERHFARELQKAVVFFAKHLKHRNGRVGHSLRTLPTQAFELDDVSFEDVLSRFHPDVREFMTSNVKADLGQDTARMSGLSGVRDQWSDVMGRRFLLKGGNIQIVEVLRSYLAKIQPPGFLRRGKVTHITRQDGRVAVSYETRKDDSFETVESDFVVVGVPSYQVGKIFDDLREPHRSLFANMAERGAYYLVNYRFPSVPIDPHVFSIIPHTRWTTDIVLTNRKEDAYLPVGSPVESVLTAYVPFTPAEKARARQPKAKVLREVRDEIVAVRPELREFLDAAIANSRRDTRVTYWAEAMSCPRPGQLRELADAGLTLGKNIFYGHSDAQHPSAPGAIEGGLEAMALVEAARKDDAPSRRRVLAVREPERPTRTSPHGISDSFV
jgi:flavin-dependent amine oxidoreductase